MNKEEFIELGEKMEQKVKEAELKEKLYLDNKQKGMLDALQEKMVSRKLLVCVTSVDKPPLTLPKCGDMEPSYVLVE